MKGPRIRPLTDLRVSASELAQMGVCERIVVFEHLYGRRRTSAQRQAIQRGLQAHQRFYRGRHLDLSANGHFIVSTRIASVLYGWLRRAVRAVLRPIRRCIARLVRSQGSGNGA